MLTVDTPTIISLVQMDDRFPNVDYCLSGQSDSVRRAEIKPPTFTDWPVGTLARDGQGNIVYELQEREFANLEWYESVPGRYQDGAQLDGYIEKYQNWIIQGHMPPPLRGMENSQHVVKITNGHHRALALYNLGYTGYKVWVKLYMIRNY